MSASPGAEEFDLVVVGAGSAGCALAGRLTENPSLRVLLLEAGGSDDVLEVQIPAALHEVWRTRRDWNYTTEPQPDLGGRRLFWPRGKLTAFIATLAPWATNIAVMAAQASARARRIRATRDSRSRMSPALTRMTRQPAARSRSSRSSSRAIWSPTKWWAPSYSTARRTSGNARSTRATNLPPEWTSNCGTGCIPASTRATRNRDA